MGPQSQRLASITFLKGPQAGKIFHIGEPVITIGRDRSNDIVITDLKVSRQHARLVWDNGAWSIERLSQISFVAVNQQIVEKQAAIKHNSTVALGEDSAFLFLIPSDEQPQNANALSDLGLATETRKPAEEFTMLAIPAGDALLSSDQHLSGESWHPPGTEIASFSILGLPTLEVTDNTTGVSHKYALAQKALSAGRDASNDIVIDDATVSDFHLQIALENNQWVLLHPHPARQSTQHGLFYQGRKIRGDKSFRKQLMPGDVFRIGDEHGTLFTLAYQDGHPISSEALPLIHDIPLQTAKISIGRLQDNDVVLDQPQVSGHHAQLTREGTTYRLTDLNSTNHLYVNGLRVTSYLLQLDDEIRIGPYKFIYNGTALTQYDESGSIRIDALNLKKVGNNAVVLLNDISLTIPPRSFIALVGSSGTGKSTLMDALNGLRPAQEGSVYYNGQDYYSHIAAFRTQLGYVPQEDIMHRDLTVERALYYAAKLRLPQDFTPAQIEQRIDEVLEDVEMTQRRKLLIKKLSGGQRKRISIALELLANPSIFFLDEPTSGLDPGLDRKLMVLLRKLADKGHTILLVTHATSNINVCDAICFLAHGGRLAYFGPPEEAKTYFQQPDFAEIYNRLEPTDEQPAIPQEAEEHFKQSMQYQTYVAEPLGRRPAQTKSDKPKQQGQSQTPKRGKPWKQFVILCQRYLELLWNDKWNLAILLLQAPIIGVILFILVHSLDETNIFQPPIPLGNQGNAQRFLFVMAFAAVMFGCINASREIIKEVHIYQRERAVNLGILPYLFSKIVILSVLCLLQSAILLAIMGSAAHFYDGILFPAIWEIYITLALTSIAGVMLGLAISALVRNNDQAMSFIPLLLIPQVIFSGSMFPLKDIPLQIFGALFSLRWSMAALGSSLNLIGNSDKIFGTCDTCNTYQHNPHYLLFTWAALIATILILGVITGVVLKRKDTVR
ncbi:MAG TPA: FHA domain-containing protein [Ktedonobacteraceae bacterium]|nr:FHA domain-containing protein [Ktedonobacteraceae bacterium]